jgi:hypothetical protein
MSIVNQIQNHQFMNALVAWTLGTLFPHDEPGKGG